jgi:hypothetical protein
VPRPMDRALGGPRHVIVKSMVVEVETTQRIPGHDLDPHGSNYPHELLNRDLAAKGLVMRLFHRPGRRRCGAEVLIMPSEGKWSDNPWVHLRCLKCLKSSGQLRMVVLSEAIRRAAVSHKSSWARSKFTDAEVRFVPTGRMLTSQVSTRLSDPPRSE